ncbi:LysM peptidoglycan-binding domain-containing protein [Streptomyces asoensis]|uniref:LysM peptidoglycan-binding domain-containing protein n=1 Tax=Streptomyces asoensis TaxID=249586 RepID=A0A6M4WTG1_9ACTN|nr:LysM peptidoglycan-binding domain-containing protein [Streptomyces asoensis]
MNATSEFYVVRAGDSLAKIAAKFHVSLAQIKEWNPQIKNVNLIHPGDRVRVVAPSEEPDGEFEPFPGKDFFQSSVSSPIIEVMGWRLIEEGCSAYPDEPDLQWSEADRRSYAKWQQKLGFSGSDADGIPGRGSWEKLHVPALHMSE